MYARVFPGDLGDTKRPSSCFGWWVSGNAYPAMISLVRSPKRQLVTPGIVAQIPTSIEAKRSHVPPLDVQRRVARSSKGAVGTSPERCKESAEVGPHPSSLQSARHVDDVWQRDLMIRRACNPSHSPHRLTWYRFIACTLGRPFLADRGPQLWSRPSNYIPDRAWLGIDTTCRPTDADPLTSLGPAANIPVNCMRAH